MEIGMSAFPTANRLLTMARAAYKDRIEKEEQIYKADILISTQVAEFPLISPSTC
jgi:hypothetical protein